jgi:hypothetical protein
MMIGNIGFLWREVGQAHLMVKFRLIVKWDHVTKSVTWSEMGLINNEATMFDKTVTQILLQGLSLLVRCFSQTSFIRVNPPLLLSFTLIEQEFARLPEFSRATPASILSYSLTSACLVIILIFN